MTKLNPLLKHADAFSIPGVGAFVGQDGYGRQVLVPQRSYFSRADLSSINIPAGTQTINVERYSPTGPVVNMVYSLNNSDQTSVDPTSMPIVAVNADGTTTTKYTKLISPKVTAAMMGAPYDNSTDDAPFIQKVVTYFGACYADGRTLTPTIKTPVKMTSGSVLDFTGGGAWRIDLASSFTNFLRDGTGQYGDTGSIIQGYGSRSGTDTPLTDLTIRGVKMAPIVTTDARFTYCVSLINVSGYLIEGNDFSGFATGGPVIINSCVGGNCVIRNNNFHDWYSNATFTGPATAQTTGVEFDADPRTFSAVVKYSTRCMIYGNRFVSFTKGATGISSGGGYQTDGINISSANQNTWHQITGNYFDTVDEAIDCFGCFNLIATNEILNVTGAAVKLPHGACDNLVQGNQIYGARLWVFSLGADLNFSVLRNRFVGNRSYQIGGIPSGTPACIAVTDYDATHICDGNIFENNTFDNDGTIPFIVDCRTQWGKNKSIGDHFLKPPTDAAGWCHPLFGATYKSFEFEKPVGGTKFKAQLSSNFAKTGTSAEVVPYTNIIVDERSEWNSTTKKLETKMPGWYTFRAEADAASLGTGTRAFLNFKGTASELGGSFDIGGLEIDTATAITNGSFCVSHTFYLPHAATVWAEFTASNGGTLKQGTNSYFDVRHD